MTIAIGIISNTALLLWLFCSSCLADTPLQHGRRYQGDLAVSEYLVSEKLDGVRAWWDGSRLRSRQGNEIAAPDWFTHALPAGRQLDGELWISRDSFARLLSTVRKAEPVDEEWQQVNYMLFDLPAEDGPFINRYRAMQTLVGQLKLPWLKVIPQQRYPDEPSLMAALQRIIAAGGEGLMLHHQDAHYRSGRQQHLLKLKQYDDAEAVVIRILPGQGRLQNRMGSLLVENSAGQRFRIGSGFTDAQRDDPPQPGDIITYRYSGLTSTGLPRFAVFLRQRNDGF